MNTILETSLGPVEYAAFGEGPAILALHGAMGGYDQGLLLARAAVGTPDFRFIAISRPGYLGTPLDAGRTPEQQADLCAAVLDALGIPQAAVMAVSGGGQCALQFALRHPQRCWGLVMISACSAPLHVPLPFRFHIIRMLAQFPPFVAAMRRKAAADPDRTASRSIPDPALRARTLSDPDAGRLLMELQLSTMDRMAQRLPGALNDIRQSRLPFAYPIEKIEAPALVVHGTADKLVPCSDSEALASRLPAAELLTVRDGEHVCLFTHLQEVRSRVARFLNRHAARRMMPER
jgi:pimeloyl-ACP methyl ester carboxylesterase